ncbi:MAG TPA: Bax inhibitor-1/YccA family protein [Alphaproteobacteria bacterium]|jgi:FtsH-binding integral membrane protein
MAIREQDRFVTRAEVGAIDEGLRAYMLRVYNYMMFGLALTGGVAYAVASVPAIQSVIFGSGLMWLFILAPIGLVLLLSFRVHKMSFASAQLTYWAYAALNGIALSTIFLAYTGESIARVFFITAAAFGALSLYGYTTKKDLSGWGSFLFMGLIGIIIAAVVNMFIASSALQFAISVIGVLVFAGLTAYDTQQIKEMYYAVDSSEIAGKKAIMGALRLYLDFLNMFIMLMQLFGNRN